MLQDVARIIMLFILHILSANRVVTREQYGYVGRI